MKFILFLGFFLFLFEIQGNELLENSRKLFQEKKYYQCVNFLIDPLVKDSLKNPWEFIRKIPLDYLTELELKLENDSQLLTYEKYLGIGEICYLQEDYQATLDYVELCEKMELPTWERLTVEFLRKNATQFLWWQNSKTREQKKSEDNNERISREYENQPEKPAPQNEEEKQLQKKFDETFQQYKNEFYVSPEDDK